MTGNDRFFGFTGHTGHSEIQVWKPVLPHRHVGRVPAIARIDSRFEGNSSDNLGILEVTPYFWGSGKTVHRPLTDYQISRIFDGEKYLARPGTIG
jgi:hypothetical protein